MEKVAKKQFAFWERENGAGNSGYWMLFGRIEEAASEANGRTIYRLDATPLGKFEIKAVLTKVRQRKRKKGKR